MIEGIWQIGNKLISQSKLNNVPEAEYIVNALVQDLNSEKNGKKQHVVILNIICSNSKWKLDVDFEEVSKNTPQKYIWVGNSSGTSSQDRLTTDDLDYLISQTIPNLIKALPLCKLKQKLEKIKEAVYFDLGPKNHIGSSEANYERNRYLMDLSKLGLNLSPEEIITEVKQYKDSEKKTEIAIKKIKKRLLIFIKSKTGLNENQISLYSLFYNNQPLVEDFYYKSYLYGKLINEVFEKDSDKGSICYICSCNDRVTWNTTKLSFKFYMTDKIGFASNFKNSKKSNGFAKNFTLCQDCYKAILMGENFIRNNLKSYLAGYLVYIVPTINTLSNDLQNQLNINKLENWSQYLKDKFDAISTLEGWQAFQQKIKDYTFFNNIQDNFALNFMFGVQVQASFKILQLIQEIPPSRLDRILKVSYETYKIGIDLFGDDKGWYINLKSISNLLPSSRLVSKNKIQGKYILQFYNNLFSGIPINYKELMKKFVMKSKELRFASKYNDRLLAYTMLKQNLLLCFLKILNLILEGEIQMNNKLDPTILENLSEDLRSLISKFDYSNAHLSLFLLGMVIGMIGIEQYRKGDSKKSILNKLQFHGMSLSKLEILYNEVLEKIRQYKIQTEGEKLYCISKLLYDENKANWNLNNHENLFYLLSGYSYTTYKAITSKKNENFEKLEEVQNEQ